MLTGVHCCISLLFELILVFIVDDINLYCQSMQEVTKNFERQGVYARANIIKVIVNFLN